MTHFNLEPEQICDSYVKEIRSILELGAPVWHSGLAVKQSRDIERVQKIALFIMLGEKFVNYDVACTIAFQVLALQARSALSKICNQES